jgi:hypothetical protein
VASRQHNLRLGLLCLTGRVGGEAAYKCVWVVRLLRSNSPAPLAGNQRLCTARVKWPVVASRLHWWHIKPREV